MIPSRICNRKTSIVLEDYRRLNSFLKELDEPVVRVIICTFEKRIQLKANDWSTKWGKSPIPEIQMWDIKNSVAYIDLLMKKQDN